LAPNVGPWLNIARVKFTLLCNSAKFEEQRAYVTFRISQSLGPRYGFPRSVESRSGCTFFSPCTLILLKLSIKIFKMI
jgi:hypothetical protein